MEYFEIAVEEVEGLGSGQSGMLHAALEKDGTYLSPNVRLCAGNKAAMLDSAELAQAYIDACKPIFVKRGQSLEFTILSGLADTGGFDGFARLEEAVKRDSDLVRARIEQGVMAHNRKPAGLD